MAADPRRIKELFAAALDEPERTARDALLDRECGDDAELRGQLAALLQAHDAPASALDRPLAEFAAVNPDPSPTIGSVAAAEHVGAVIGPYKLLEPIGEGGMGTVWMAQQTEPVKRVVALKLIKAGMDSKQVIARFEAERQALALMDHPNIAKVLDGGTTGRRRSGLASSDDDPTKRAASSTDIDIGRPYFVMDLVKGVPITRYCDEHHLTPRQRLELFIPVCQAIQHAHQKGIIHRDLKPSNVLVALYDGKPVPKVIDFGVAKAAGQSLTDKTLVTGFGNIVGTLEYMSPEQAEINQLDIDTRSDIYSLGVLLYELLAGSPPFTRKDLEKAGMLEMLRVIREDEPSKPSTKLSTAEGLPTLAANRGTEPAKLTKLVRGELDWIVMKALEKNRNRRYETASDFVLDLQRYLADEPVQACPPSAGYRLRKFVRRNMRAVLALTAIFLLLIAGIAGTTWGLVRAENFSAEETRQRRLAEAAATAESEQRSRAEGALKKAAREAAIAAAINDFLNKDVLLPNPLGQGTPGLISEARLKLSTVLQRAAQRIDGKFVNEPEVEMQIRYTIGNALTHVGDYAGALAQYQKVVPYFQETLGPDHPETLLAEYRLAFMHRHLGQSKTARALLEQNLEKHKAVLGLEHAQTLVSMSGLATAYWGAGQKEKALVLYEQTLELRKRHLGPDHPDTLVSMSNVAACYLPMQVDRALPLLKETLAEMEKKLPSVHPERLNTTRNLARAYHAAEQIDKAIPLEELALRQFKSAYGVDYAMTQATIEALIASYVEMGWCDKAQALLTSIESGGANRPTIENSRLIVWDRLDIRLLGVRRPTSDKEWQDLREKSLRDFLQRMRPAADKYQQELAAKKADHPDTLAARQAFALVLRTLRTPSPTSAAAYHLKAVLDARQRLLGADHPDTQTCRLELGTTRLQQKKYAEAESLLLEAYAGLKQHKSTSRAIQALKRLVQLYDSWDKKDKATEWRQKLDEQKKQ